MERIYNKLVRDNIPDICRANGEEPFIRILSDKEYWKYLLKKDQEELDEVATAESLDERKKELADKLELIRAMAEFSGFSLSEIKEEADRKKQKNGGFEKRLLLEKVVTK
ncbi:MAG: nucleoside triphosphate pyrophosphohydrolase [Bacilli bacterium]|nr:nucleoside triphosphate pyrophosphohydrolase [Bacilli bacterium]MBP3635394.1 nucleoside triphosphate pyrophosphohydrolase [Bacilli bacterium]